MADISKIKLPDNTTHLIKDSKAFSRGEQLITNGTCVLGDNTNFSNWTFDGSHSNSSPGSFTRTSTSYANINSDDFFPVNANSSYCFEFDLLSKNNAGTMYAYLSFFDVDKLSVTAYNCMYYPDTTTTLARELKAGDTKVYLTDASQYRTYGSGSHQRALIFWDYKNSFGYQYPVGTYSRYILQPAWVDDNSIDYTNNIITLANTYTGVTHPAGTSISQGNSGGTYKYSGITGQKVPTTWTHYTGYYEGIDYSGQNKADLFPPATAYCKVGFLWNYNSANDQFWVTNISVKEVPAAKNAVDFGGSDTGLGNNTPAANAKTYFLDENKVKALRPKVFYNTSGFEFTTFFSKGSVNGNYGSILKWGYGDRYIRILRRISGNWSTEDWEKTDAGYADTAGYADSLTCHVVSGADAINAFRGARFRTGRVTSYTAAGLASNDGMIVWIPYSDSYGQQLLFDDTAHFIKSRYYNNGTWGAWSANLASLNAQINALDTASSTPVDADYYISQFVGGGTTTTTYHRRPMSALWAYVKGKIESIVLSTSTSSTSTTTAATSSAVKTAYDLANTANGTANTALSGVNGTLIYDHTYTITNGVATFVPHVYLKGQEVTSNYAASCFTWKYRLANSVTSGTPTYVNLTTDTTTKGCSVAITTLGYGGYVLGQFTPPA